jgi:kumamolisin
MEQLTDRYSFPRGLTGHGECIGILAFGGGVAHSDLTRYFLQQTGSVPELRFQNATSTNRPNVNSEHDCELALDIQSAAVLAPRAKIVTYFSSRDEKGWIDTLTRAIHDEENRPSVLSISWGATEDCWGKHTLHVLNELFEDAASLGITVCAASGDAGCSSDSDGNCRVTFPASSPFVLACGGTSDEAGGCEVVWNERNQSASGGGISDRVKRPNWQPPNSSHESSFVPSRRDPEFDGRRLPDVSGLASRSYSVYVGGRYQNGVGGTSAVAPLWSALVARLNEGLKNAGLPSTGCFHPLLYNVRILQDTFTQITRGHNDPFGGRGYEAHPGWNPCCGWGTPNGERLLAALLA